MTDVTTWSPADDANAAPPPAGWPEFMMPSMVNNTGRAMMGAVRRMYDDLNSGTFVLPYLKLSGGTVSGNILVTGSVNANFDVTAGRNMSVANNLSVSGSVVATYDVNAGRNINVAGAIFAGGSITATGNIAASGGGVYGSSWAIIGSGGNVNFGTGAAGTLALLTLHTNTLAVVGSASVAGGVTVASIAPTAFYAPYGGITVAGVASSGSVTTAGNIAAGSATVSGSVVAGGGAGISGTLTVGGDIIGEGNRIWCGPIGGQMALIRDTAGSANYLQFLAGWGLIFKTNTGRASWNGPPGAEMWVMEGPCYANQSYVGGHGAYVDFSDIRLKDPDSIAPATVGLAEVLKLKPVTFTRLKRAVDNDLVKYPTPRQELGFVAQDVAEALPHATIAAELPDGPALGVTSGAIVAALVNAIKTIDQRLTAGGL